MLEVKPIDSSAAKKYCNTKKIEYINGTTTVISAIEQGSTLGTLVYDIADNKMIIKFIEPTDDFILADGIFRSALFIAANKSIMDIYWQSPVPNDLINKLGFVKDEQEKSIDVTNLFSSCESCKKS